jgi:benzodiazapine receptor
MALPMRKTSPYLRLAGLIILFMAIGATIGMVTEPGKDMWYQGLLKSSLNPPDWVFGVVWSTLYLMMAAAFWLLIEKPAQPGVKNAHRLFIIQLIVNWAWSFVFFTLHLKFLSFVWILALVGLVIATIRAMWPITRPGALLLLPYLGWISFASYLAGTIWALN